MPTFTEIGQIEPPLYNFATMLSRYLENLLGSGNIGAPPNPYNIDIPLSPTNTMWGRLAQGYALSPAPHIMGQAAGTLGNFMAPNVNLDITNRLGEAFSDRTPTNLFAPFQIPGRAYGGPVAAGQPYVVGEQGPEVVIPQSNAMVMPNPQGPMNWDWHPWYSQYSSGPVYQAPPPAPPASTPPGGGLEASDPTGTYTTPSPPYNVPTGSVPPPSPASGPSTGPPYNPDPRPGEYRPPGYMDVFPHERPPMTRPAPPGPGNTILDRYRELFPSGLPSPGGLPPGASPRPRPSQPGPSAPPPRPSPQMPSPYQTPPWMPRPGS